MAEEINVTTDPVETVEPEKVETVETPKIDYEAELSKAMAEIKKLKSASDKNASEAAEYKRKWKSTLDETQQASLARQEEEKAMREELESLRKEKAIAQTKSSYLAMGYPEELADKASVATYESDTATLIAVQKSVIEMMQKQMKAEMTKNMPTPPISNDGETAMTQEQFDKLSIAEQVEFKNKNPELFKKFTSF